MDGEFFSLFPRDVEKDNYTLTHVKYTPLIKSKNINDINNFTINDKLIKHVRCQMENSVKEYYKTFDQEFEYYNYFTSFKCKNQSTTDSRSCNIYHNDNIISVNCGKITGIFEFEDYIINHLDKIL